jgi:predicted acylesterase/phospholipase RssA
VLNIPWLKIESITGTSAGAMNAVVLNRALPSETVTPRSCR